MTDLVRGIDGELARVVGPWSAEKLFYIERYVGIFTTGMKYSWPRRVYIDLFSGPGRCVIEDTAEEIAGSPLVALDARYPFTHAYLNDNNLDAVNALRQRVRSFDQTQTTVHNLDCNEAARDAARQLALDESGTIGLAVIDPTAFQISLEAIEEMTRGRKIDLIVTLMTGHLRRFIAMPNLEPKLDPFFGSSAWRGLVDLRQAGGRVTYRKLLDFYEDQLRSIGYTEVDDSVRILNSKEQTLYHLVFASKHTKGAEFFRKISQRKFAGQHRMDLT